MEDEDLGAQSFPVSGEELSEGEVGEGGKDRDVDQRYRIIGVGGVAGQRTRAQILSRNHTRVAISIRRKDRAPVDEVSDSRCHHRSFFDIQNPEENFFKGGMSVEEPAPMYRLCGCGLYKGIKVIHS
ncbi:hypothetical protein SISSUDRAFT_1034496 [Sistotremastrum suecicum HHB10207 ss-3]|uniref:Uncharacterized protein n=1 Tax=Sistotremastrum suecicum HHB10207 ss-3 TaxID=1314776 RepID=A0A166BZC8_9AGAM|nr:hypothetical protein SISSUDRAFT_1034496 [Sistotremastrum suecicum HHB10207 ss-3]